MGIVSKYFKKKEPVDKKVDHSLPFRSQILCDKAIGVIVKILSENSAVLYGDFSVWIQLDSDLKEKVGVPTFIEARLRSSENRVISIANEIFVKLQGVDSTLRINPECPNIIETNKRGWWEPAVHLSYDGEPRYKHSAPVQNRPASIKGELLGILYYYLVLEKTGKRDVDFDNCVKRLLNKLVERVVISERERIEIDKSMDKFVQTIDALNRTRFTLRWDLSKSRLDDKIDILKRELQKEFERDKYHLHGVVSYKLSEDDIEDLIAVKRQIIYFSEKKLEELSINFNIKSEKESYNKIISTIQKVNNVTSVLTKFKLRTNIKDAKTRYDKGVLDFKKDNSLSPSIKLSTLLKTWEIKYLYYLNVSCYPLPDFIKTGKSFFGRLKKLSEDAEIDMELTSDYLPFSEYGCYVLAKKIV